jgi:hypothetical protein
LSLTFTGCLAQNLVVSSVMPPPLSVIGISTRLKNGMCNPSETAPLAGQQQQIQAVGRVTLP